MATYTTNYNFKKPAQEDFYNVEDFNGNADVIDKQLKEVSDKADRIICNPNLLINGNFQIWQRGETFLTNGYIADRWRVKNNGTIISITRNTADGGVHFAYSQVEYINCVQYFENVYGAQEVTLSAEVKGVKGTSLFLAIGGTTDINTITGEKSFTATGDWQTISLTATLPQEDIVWVNVSGREECTDFYIKWAKLEVGKTATTFVPRTTGEELLLCQRYYRTFPMYFGTHTTFAQYKINNQFTLMLEPEMRTVPTANFVDCRMSTTSSVEATQDVTFSASVDSTSNMLYIIATTVNTTPDALFVVNRDNGLTLDAEIY